MKLLWNKKVEMADLWIPECFGQFVKRNKKVSFFFKNDRHLLLLSEEDVKPRILCSEEDIPLPHNWKVVESRVDTFLLFSEDYGLNLKNFEFSCDISSPMRMMYNQQKRPEKYYEEAPQSLGEYTILHKGNCGYVCMKENLKLWEFTGKAYLYTDMMCWKDRLFFGTGGHGGYFYVLDIRNGLPLTAIKTGGTQCIIHADNLCYVLKNDKKGELLCIDLSDGSVVSRSDLPGTVNIDSRITRIDNLIHVITFDVSRSKAKGFIWSCIEI